MHWQSPHSCYYDSSDGAEQFHRSQCLNSSSEIKISGEDLHPFWTSLPNSHSSQAPLPTADEPILCKSRTRADCSSETWSDNVFELHATALDGDQ